MIDNYINCVFCLFFIIMYLKTFFMLSTAITDTDLKKELAPAVKQASKDWVIAKKIPTNYHPHH